MIITLLAVVVWVPVACNILLHLTGHEHARQRSERLETTSIYLKLGKLEPEATGYLAPPSGVRVPCAAVAAATLEPASPLLFRVDTLTPRVVPGCCEPPGCTGRPDATTAPAAQPPFVGGRARCTSRPPPPPLLAHRCPTRNPASAKQTSAPLLPALALADPWRPAAFDWALGRLALRAARPLKPPRHPLLGRPGSSSGLAPHRPQPRPLPHCRHHPDHHLLHQCGRCPCLWCWRLCPCTWGGG